MQILDCDHKVITKCVVELNAAAKNNVQWNKKT